MAFIDNFRFSFRSGPSTWLYWNNGVLATSGTAKYISVPHEWKKTELKWRRSYEMRGHIHTITTPYQFVEDGASILRSEYYSGSIEKIVYITIEQRKPDITGYDVLFEGEIDLSTFNDGVLYNGYSRAVAASVIEGGITAKLAAIENIPQEILLDPASSDAILCDGIKMQNDVLLGIANDPTANANVHQMFMPISIIHSESDINVDVVAQPSQQALGYSGTNIKDWIFYTASVDNTVEIEYSLDFDLTNPSSSSLGAHGFQVVIAKYNPNTLAVTGYQIFVEAAFATYIGNNTKTGTVSIPMLAGETLSYVSGLDPFDGSAGTSAFLVHQSYNYSTLRVKYDFQLPSSLNYSIPYRTLISRFLEQVTGISGVMSSLYFSTSALCVHDCYPYNLRVTCGDALRGLSGAKIRITWADLKRDMRSRLGLGVSVRNNLVVISPSRNFFNENIIIADLGSVKTMVTEPARDYLCTSQKWGYPNYQYDKLNGRDEPNTTQVWKWPTVRVQKDEDNICPFRSDMYGIEFTRFNASQKTTTDASSDNDTFVIETEASATPITIGGITLGAAFHLYRPQNSNTQPANTGLLFPETAFNLTQTGKRNFLRSGDFTRSCLYGLENNYITFQTTDKNAELAINCGSGTIVEKDPILISDLDAPFFKPTLMHIEHVTPIAMKAAMDARPDGCFTLTEDGKQYKGFPIEVGLVSAHKNSYQSTLLATADCDLTQRIV